MATVIGKTSVGVALTITPGSGSGTNEDLIRILLQADPNHDWTFGTGSYQVNKWYENITTGLTVGAGSASSLDLDSLGGLGGETVAFTGIKILWIYNPSTTAGDTLTVAGDWFTTNVGTSYKIYPGSCLFIPSPITALTVTATTADTLSITNGNATTAKTAKIFLAGN